jgi:hypothetical protein
MERQEEANACKVEIELKSKTVNQLSLEKVASSVTVVMALTT